jgi:hypothetical protein
MKFIRLPVCNAMVHDGTFPFATDSKTSVSTTAIYRLTEPFCYQNMLPIYRLIDGERTIKDIIHKSSPINK